MFPSDDSRLLARLWLRTPLRIATTAPSGLDVSTAMAAEADPDAPGWTVELGGGTGPITRALLERGVAPDRLLVLEQDPDLHAVLRERFPDVHAIRADAGDLRRLLHERDADQIASVISTLPILTMPSTAQRSILAESFAAMGTQGRFVQITYMPGSPVPRRRLERWGYRAERATFLARNFPPASIWRYTRAPAG